MSAKNKVDPEYEMGDKPFSPGLEETVDETEPMTTLEVFSKCPTPDSTNENCGIPNTKTKISQPPKSKTGDNFGQKLAERKSILRHRRIAANVEFLLALLGIIFMLVDNELYIRYKPEYTKNGVTSNLLRGMVTFLTLLLMASVIFYGWTVLRMRVVNNGLNRLSEAATPYFVVKLVAELVVCAFHPVPGWASVWIKIPKLSHTERYVDGILCVLMCFRLYIVIRFASVNTDMYLDTSLRSLCAVNGIEVDTAFVVKAYLSRFPGTILMAIVILVVGVESWAMRTCEVYYSHTNDLHGFPENLWLISITFLTVGYGDVYPQSYCGRFISVTTGFLGVCATALVIALLSRKMEQSKPEKLISQYAERARLEKKKKRIASFVVRNTLKLWVQKRRGNPRPNYTERIESVLQKNVNSMQELRSNKSLLEQDAAETNGDTAALMELKMLVERTRADILRMEECLQTAVGKATGNDVFK